MNASASGTSFEPAWVINSIEECTFYHTMDVPGHGTVDGAWDLRSNVGDYLAGYNFKDKRVIDIGTASGMLSFHMEEQRAEVVSFDGLRWKTLPPERDLKSAFDKVKNSYWLSHKLRNSKCKVLYGDIYNLPEWLGKFDLAVFGSVLLHLEHPYLALQSAARLAKIILVIDVIRKEYLPDQMVFRPDFPNESDFSFWWNIPERSVSKMLHTLGFVSQRTHYLTANGKNGNSVNLYSIIGNKL